MKKEYKVNKIEKFVQNFWKKNKVFQVKEDNTKKKYYCLSMIPYPSGELHMGHVRNYTIGDAIARYQRMIGKNVLHPIGWDAFGLPAEIAAIKNKTNPKIWTKINISQMKKQLQKLGFSYDWSREITTCDSNYYRWQQWFFLKLYEKGIAYKKKSYVNWCKTDHTVLANEQVIDSKCWRCGTKIEKKKLSQWFLKITKYAPKLLLGLKKLKNWPNEVKEMQKNWIGKYHIFQVKFKIFKTYESISIEINKLREIQKIYFICINRNSYIFQRIKKKRKEKIKFFDEIIFSKLYAIDTINKKFIPILFTNKSEKKSIFIIFKKDVKNSIFLRNLKKKLQFEKKRDSITFFDSNFIDYEKYETTLKKSEKYKIHDWCISRQRYWGAPIPVLTDKNNNIFLEKEENLPINFPKKINKKSIKKWRKKNSKKFLLRETDTFDTFVESSWYYARYTNPSYQKEMLDKKSMKYWMPIDQYIGGIEHANMHLIYFRFYHKLLKDFGFTKFSEPVDHLLCQGMVLNEAYYYLDKNRKKIWISQNEIKKEYKKEKKISDTSSKNLIYYGKIKMSKSKNNGVSPNKILKKYGADVLRMYIIFAAPTRMDIIWEESGLIGMQRFLQKLWKFVYEYLSIKKCHQDKEKKITKKQLKMRKIIYTTILQITEDFEIKKNFNTSIAKIMYLVNKLIEFKKKEKKFISIIEEGISAVIRMLYPFAPHICFFLWYKIYNSKNIDFVSWPKIDKNALKFLEYKIIVQINGKFKKLIKTEKDIQNNEIIEFISKIEKIKKILKKIKIKKIVYIKNKLINLVTY
ncbi:class I tRNA ligase family protein [bacterium endosymbiont of Pedicinus badii]|uniref:class I tRNA ligase family protein n=1 Tax=bacterium endosymbiont of Pedicinus badii TaxID=1719126 RepID=UPI0009BB4F75|nr:class I tRNA ligase family protein [bacterium endosymbiont of Pedicinus badii]OQM34311.1 hypothetical protein AOQ89_00210 [bacterium endosymbiont of Pedicinus badii]